MFEFVQDYWFSLFVAAFERAIALTASLHAVLRKRETRAVIGWVGLIWLAPLMGSFLYYCFGINRIQRRGSVLQEELNRALSRIRIPISADATARLEEVQAEHADLSQLAHAVEKITHRPLLPGNKITPLQNGDTAYPDMLNAIEQAKQSITLQSYIFDADEAGRLFVDALAAAQRRGVEVRVLIDDVGAKYSQPTVIGELNARDIPCHTFLPTLWPSFVRYANLRNHRKIMVVDGVLGYTGGMNIRHGCLLQSATSNLVQDLHFRVEGPVVTHLQESFASDWAFAAGETLRGEKWLPNQQLKGRALSRGIADGPDDAFERLLMTILAAVGLAKQRIVLATPYFLPDPSLIHALNVAALRGVEVTILLPEESNNHLVQWASTALLPQVLEYGCRIYYTQPPFDHTKLMVVDGTWSLVGSANLDPRSLRLNFEFNIECYSPDLAAQLLELAEAKLSTATELTMDVLDSQHIVWRIRNGLARLMTPYL